MAETADILVIGLGAVGSAALYHAAKLGAHVIGIDRFAPPHDQGSSHGDTRITRQAIGEGSEFVPLVLRSNQIWEELESLTGRTLLTRNGALILASPDVPGNHHGSTSFLGDTISVAKTFAIEHEVLNSADLRRRYPQFRLRGDEVGYLEAGAGYLRLEACINTQLELARQFGAQIHTFETAAAISPQADGTVAIRAAAGIYSAAKLIVTAGPWIANLLGPQYAEHFKVYRQVMYWFALSHHAERFAPENFPVFIWIAGDQPRNMLYGFPAVDGPDNGVKIAAEQYESVTTPEAVNRTVDNAEAAAMYAEYVAPRFTGISEKCLRAATCLYTVTADAKFIIDHLLGSENILFASACSGHGFKHSAAVGEALALRALGMPAPVDLSMFSLQRLYGHAI